MKFITEHKGLMDAIKSWLSVAAVFSAGIYSFIEYVDHKESERVERSLSYVKSYRGGKVSDAKVSLNLLLQKNQAALTEILSSQTTNEDLQKQYSDFILKLTTDQDAQKNLEITFSYFEEIAICVEHALCDKEVVLSFFLNDAKSLFNSYYPYVCSLRKEWKNPAVYLKLEHLYVQSEKDIC